MRCVYLSVICLSSFERTLLLCIVQLRDSLLQVLPVINLEYVGQLNWIKAVI